MREGVTLSHEGLPEVVAIDVLHIDMIGIKVIGPLGEVIRIATTALRLLAQASERSLWFETADETLLGFGLPEVRDARAT